MQPPDSRKQIYISGHISQDQGAIGFAKKGKVSAGVPRCFDHGKGADTIILFQCSVHRVSRPGPVLLLPSRNKVLGGRVFSGYLA
ncbi:hypothetical protein D3C80_1822890 [compost metagenome]